MALNFIQIVRKNYDGFTKRDVERAVLAHEAAGLIVHPSERDLKYLVSRNLTDCPVTILDVNNNHKIFGPILGVTRGKAVRQNPEHVTTNYVAIPRDFLTLQRFVSLVAHVMFVHNKTFLTTMFRGIKFVTVEYISARTAKELSKKLNRVMKLYGQGSVISQTILMDMEFDSTKDELMGKTVVNTYSAKEHVTETECCICTAK